MDPADVIFEVVLATESPEGRLHLAPMGVRYRGRQVVVMPFRPSTTLDNLLATRHGVLNIVTDTRVFAGCVTGRRDWPTVALGAHAPQATGAAPPGAGASRGHRLACALRHLVLQLAEVQDDAQRPVLTLDVLEDVTHAPFPGLNRAQAAVIEAAVLVSRLHLLPLARIEQEMAIGQNAVDRTASAAEHEAWGWLCEAVQRHRSRQALAA